ncbi:MAG: hypothetical protein H7Z37_02930 [Pyrinomonadaceae bacterium]|nr:hypothetical protein [Pyrinomonadaceae bacterium]
MKTFTKTVTRLVLAILLLTTTATFRLSAQTCSPAPVGLISWYSGDGDVRDLAGTNNAALNVNGFAIGSVGQAFKFNNLRGIDVADNAVFNQPNFTIEAWATANAFSCPTACAQFIAVK